MQPESQPPAPAVVAVVVTCDPGPWFEQALASLAATDYPNLSVLILDAGSEVDPTPTVAGILPGAFVRRLGQRVGYGRAANEVLGMVEGASHYLFCHDDVALAPDAIRMLVEEAFRSNAGIATPKYVHWDAPDHLIAVGATTDKVGVWRDLVEPGELDQEQHDVVREVLIAPSGCTLVRADLFSALGGFDPVVDQFGEDIDLSWRAGVAGARVTAVPSARVRHLQATQRGERPGWSGEVARRRVAAATDTNRIRTMVACYRWYDLLWVLPLAFVWVLGEAVTCLGQGRPSEGWSVIRSFFSAFRRPSALWRARRRTQRSRGVTDSSIRKMQGRGNTRFRAFLRRRVDGAWEGLPHLSLPGRLGHTDFEDPDEDGDSPPVTVTARALAFNRTNALIGVVLLVVLAVGTRDLIGHHLPAIGVIPNTSSGWSSLWRSWWAAWQPNGLGVPAPSSPALGLLGVIATVLFGAVGTLQHVVVLGPLLIGPIGAYRVARWWGSRRGQVIAMVAYAIVPVPYNALARGHWGGLVAFAAAPWILSMLGRLSGEIPFPGSRVGHIRARVLGVAVLVAVVASVAPSFLYVVPIVGVALLAGSAVAGRPFTGVRMVAVALVASVVGFVLLLPWSGTIIGSGVATFGPSLGSTGRLGFGAVLRFHTGPFGGGWLGWAFLLAAALPLFIGQGWRLAWAARLWVVALALFAATWAGSRGWFPALPPEVALAPAAAALAGCMALGAAAFELDLPGYHFGWRQVAAGVGGLALAVASLPLIGSSGNGHWRLPTADASSVLAFLPTSQGGDYRVLWVGAPDALPLAGRQLYPGIAYGTSFDGEPSLADDWPTGSAGAAPALASDLSLVSNRLTTKLGHLLAPAAVRYIVVPANTAPTGAGGRQVLVPTGLLAGLGLQTDLQAVDVGDPNYSVYENSAWTPARSVLPAVAGDVASEDAVTARRALQQLDLNSDGPVLTGGGSDGVKGPVPAGATVFFGSTRSGRWRLDVEGISVAPTPAFGWGMTFQIPAAAGGSGSGASGSAAAPALVDAKLSYHPSIWIRLAEWLEVIVWVAVIVFLVIDLRRRRKDPDAVEEADPSWFEPTAPVAAAPRRRPPDSSSGTLGSADFDSLTGDEVWSDA